MSNNSKSSAWSIFLGSIPGSAVAIVVIIYSYYQNVDNNIAADKRNKETIQAATQQNERIIEAATQQNKNTIETSVQLNDVNNKAALERTVIEITFNTKCKIFHDYLWNYGEMFWNAIEKNNIAFDSNCEKVNEQFTYLYPFVDMQSLQILDTNFVAHAELCINLFKKKQPSNTYLDSIKAIHVKNMAKVRHILDDKFLKRKF